MEENDWLRDAGGTKKLGRLMGQPPKLPHKLPP